MFRGFALALSLLLLSCDITYIADSADPRLPHFSTTGRNAAGAYVNDVPWMASCGPLFSCNNERLVYVEGEDYTELRLPRSTLKYDNALENSSSPFLTLVFRLKGNQLEAIKNLNSNDVLTFELDANLNRVEMALEQSVNQIDILSENGIGQLHFRHTEAMTNGEHIVAGTFGFVVDDQTGYYKVRSGRFDFRFGI